MSWSARSRNGVQESQGLETHQLKGKKRKFSRTWYLIEPHPPYFSTGPPYFSTGHRILQYRASILEYRHRIPNSWHPGAGYHRAVGSRPSGIACITPGNTIPYLSTRNW
eukprot:1824485-Rhodomonas_salina.1